MHARRAGQGVCLPRPSPPSHLWKKRPPISGLSRLKIFSGMNVSFPTSGENKFFMASSQQVATCCNAPSRRSILNILPLVAKRRPHKWVRLRNKLRKQSTLFGYARRSGLSKIGQTYRRPKGYGVSPYPMPRFRAPLQFTENLPKIREIFCQKGGAPTFWRNPARCSKHSQRQNFKFLLTLVST